MSASRIVNNGKRQTYETELIIKKIERKKKESKKKK